MSLIILLLSLLGERLWRQLAQWRDYQWFDAYADWITGVLPAGRANGWVGLIALVLPVLLFVWLLQLLFDDALFGLLEIAFGVAVLFYTFGPRDLDADTEELIEAWELNDAPRARAAARSLTGEEPPETAEELGVAAARAIPYQAHVRVFGVIFWFLLLGPVGAAFYRIAQQLDEAGIRAAEEREGLTAVSRLLHGALAWPSSRLLAATFTLTGSFEEARAGWRRGSLEAVDLPDSNRRVLVDTGAGAVRLEETALAEADPIMLRRLRGLVVRSLVVWVVAVALFVLLGVF
jgi:membrane protein required for beta-lactamase induction